MESLLTNFEVKIAALSIVLFILASMFSKDKHAASSFAMFMVAGVLDLFLTATSSICLEAIFIDIAAIAVFVACYRRTDKDLYVIFSFLYFVSIIIYLILILNRPGNIPWN